MIQSSDGRTNQQSRKRGEKEWKAKENGRSNGSRHSASDQDGESETEGDEDDGAMTDESGNLQNGEATRDVNESEPSSAEHSEKPPCEDVKTEPLNTEAESKTENVENQEEKKEMNGKIKEEEEPTALQNGIGKSVEENKEEAADDSPKLPRRTRSRMTDGEFGLEEHGGVTFLIFDYGAVPSSTHQQTLP